MSLSRTHIEELAASAGQCLAPLGQASTLPPSLFEDSAWFDEERRRVFHSGWVAVARSTEVATPNQFITTTIAGEPCVVIRRREGGLAALSNVCRHRSTTIVGEQSGSLASLQCPYHLWTYAQDGQLRVAPGMEQAEGFDPADICLPRFAVDEWHGFVLVNVDANARPLRECAPTLDALFAEHRIGETVSLGSSEQSSPWNWKIVVENFLESYHHRGVHGETLEPIYPGAQSFVPPTGDEPWTAVDHVSVVDGEEPFLALAVYPSLLVAITRKSGMAWFRVDPADVDRTSLTIEAFVLPELAGDAEIGDETLAILEAINDEDTPINQRTAVGLKSKFASPGRISHLEAGTWHFRQWLLSQMRESERVDGNDNS